VSNSVDAVGTAAERLIIRSEYGAVAYELQTVPGGPLISQAGDASSAENRSE
jgi:hypothetical protein